MPSFTIARSDEETLSLRSNSLPLPVNDLYLEHLLLEKGIAVGPGEELDVDDAFARNALEEALSELGWSIAAAQSRRSRLLSICLGMTDSCGPAKKKVSAHEATAHSEAA